MRWSVPSIQALLMPAGAKGKYEPETVDRIIRTLELGMTQAAACNVGGIHVDTFHEWMNTRPEFSERVKSARDNGKREALERIIAAAKLPQHWQAAAWYLERSFPAEYRQRIETIDSSKLEAEVREMAKQMGIDLDGNEGKRAVEHVAEMLRQK